MRLLCQFEYVDIDNNYIVVPVGNNSAAFRFVLRVNEAGRLLLSYISDAKTEREIVNYLIHDYDISQETASKYVSEFINTLRSLGLLDG